MKGPFLYLVYLVKEIVANNDVYEASLLSLVT